MPEINPYAYAKACGIIGKAFIGKRVSSLYGLHTLNDLDKLLFPDFFPNLPSNELLPDLERRITNRAASQIFAIVDSYSKPPMLIEQMLRTYEYDDLKTCIHAAAANKKELPDICDIGRFRKVNFKAFPDFKKMLKNTEFEFLLGEELNEISHKLDIVAIENKIDDLFYNNLAKSLERLTDEDRAVMRHYLTDEISLRNCARALRLRSYYHKEDEEILSYLTDIRIHGKKKGSLTHDAVLSAGYPLDSRSGWDDWKWEELLNQEEYNSSSWKADPVYFQNAASKYLSKLAMKMFRRNPMTVSAIFCFIKLIQLEEDILTSIAEGLALGMDSAAVFALLEVSE